MRRGGKVYYKYKDHYAQAAKKQRLRSRSWFKLDAMDQVDSLLNSGITVVDLGAAPGGWSLCTRNKIGNTGRIIACDILSMRKISGVDFFQGDCADPNVVKLLSERLGYQKKAQVVLSDMSPNITGISIIDVNKSIYLGGVALKICHKMLISGGTFVVKVFQGKELNQYLCDVQSLFHIVKICKPDASRAYSREVYIIAKNFKA